MAVSKRLFAYYLLKSSSNNEGHHLVVLSLDIIMDKCSTLASPNCHNFISGSKRFVRHGMGTMEYHGTQKSFGFQVRLWL